MTCGMRSTRPRCTTSWAGRPKHTDFDDGLRATIDWYRNNESWWRPTERRGRGRLRGARPMKVRELAVPGAWEITPQVHTDARGLFFEWFTDSEFTEFDGAPPRSAAGQLFGVGSGRAARPALRAAAAEPGQVRDVPARRGVRRGRRHPGRLTDIRQWDSVLLDDRDRRSVYLSEGLAHAFLALEDDSTVMYLCSAAYTPDREHTINPIDPAIGIAWPRGREPILSDRDRAARPWSRFRRRVCCRHGTRPRRSSTSCAAGTNPRLG